jgi:hypothetical protein
MPDNWGYRHVPRICNSYCFSTTTFVTRTHLSVTLYVHCVSCFTRLAQCDSDLQGGIISTRDGSLHLQLYIYSEVKYSKVWVSVFTPQRHMFGVNLHLYSCITKALWCGVKLRASRSVHFIPGERESPRYPMNKEAAWALEPVWTLGKRLNESCRTPQGRCTGNCNDRIRSGLGARSQPSDSRLLAKRKIGATIGQEIYHLFRSVKNELGRNVPISYLPYCNADCGLLLAETSFSWLQYLCHSTARKNDIPHIRSAC